jgi:hypothetical protein
MKSKFLFPLILVAGLMLVNFSVYQVCGQTTHQAKDTCMKQDNKKMMCDSTMMKKGHMMHDSTMMKKGHKMNDSTMMKHNYKGV